MCGCVGVGEIVDWGVCVGVGEIVDWGVCVGVGEIVDWGVCVGVWVWGRLWIGEVECVGVWVWGRLWIGEVECVGVGEIVECGGGVCGCGERGGREWVFLFVVNIGAEFQVVGFPCAVLHREPSQPGQPALPSRSVAHGVHQDL